ncbi:hypothetical protein [Paraburkholderia hospita]|uniref:hypothetical protein n=1 Tax=Paraburkholderia hospita TaxID=169430 RepID=UPI00131A4078|nr:hypothetical protein [Paraburkholderia hospita]
MMGAQMRQFAVELGTDAAKQQDANSQAMSEVVGRVLQEVSASVAQLQATRDAAATQDQARNEALTRRTEEVVGNLSVQLKAMVEAVTVQIARTQANIDALQSVSIRAIDGMNNGAATMNTAANRFETAGASVTTGVARQALRFIMSRGQVVDQIDRVVLGDRRQRAVKRQRPRVSRTLGICAAYEET